MLQVVVLTCSPLTEQQHVADLCHQLGIAVIIADTRGLFGYAVHRVLVLSVSLSVCLSHFHLGLYFKNSAIYNLITLAESPLVCWSVPSRHVFQKQCYL